MKEIKLINRCKSIKFDSSMLKVGEMMEMTVDNGNSSQVGDILLKAFDCIVNLRDPLLTYTNSTKITGRKLEDGEQVLLTQ